MGRSIGWPSISTNTPPNVSGAPHRWTKLHPGEFACSACTNMQKICFEDLNGRLEALPLPAQAIKRETPKMIHLFVAEVKTATRDDS